jgi:hypothetical protein
MLAEQHVNKREVDGSERAARRCPDQEREHAAEATEMCRSLLDPIVVSETPATDVRPEHDHSEQNDPGNDEQIACPEQISQHGHADPA